MHQIARGSRRSTFAHGQAPTQRRDSRRWGSDGTRSFFHGFTRVVVPASIAGDESIAAQALQNVRLVANVHHRTTDDAMIVNLLHRALASVGVEVYVDTRVRTEVHWAAMNRLKAF